MTFNSSRCHSLIHLYPPYFFWKCVGHCVALGSQDQKLFWSHQREHFQLRMNTRQAWEYWGEEASEVSDGSAVTSEDDYVLAYERR